MNPVAVTISGLIDNGLTDRNHRQRNDHRRQSIRTAADRAWWHSRRTGGVRLGGCWKDGDGNQTAQFPMIDPFTGGTGETMMLQKVGVRYRPRWLLAFPILGALAMLTVDEGGNASNLLIFALAGILLGWLVSLIAGLLFPVCTLLLFSRNGHSGFAKSRPEQ